MLNLEKQIADLLATPESQRRREIAKLLVRTFFKEENSEEPLELTDGQADIFLVIFLKEKPRNEVIAYTQYGKSTTIAVAIILRSIAFAEPFAIVTGSEPKSQIIMEKVITHIFDHPKILARLDFDPKEPLERLKRERNKKRITFLGGGEVRTYSADSRNRRRVKESLAGFGSPNVIEDEASLIENDVQAMILRMLGGHKKNFLLKIGNPFFRNHFLKTWNDPKYNRIFIDYKQGIREGRITEDFVNEMRDEPFFRELYDCLFPEEGEVDERGWRQLITESRLDERTVEPGTVESFGRKRLGVDIGGGKAYSSFVERTDNVARKLEKNRDPDTMANVGRIIRYMQERGIEAEDVFIDDTGIGHGVSDRLHELGHAVNAIRTGDPSTNKRKYKNKKAEVSWLAAAWIKADGYLEKDPDWVECSVVRYKENSSSQLIIEPKEDLSKRGVPSPDVWDGLALTFAEKIVNTSDDYAVA